ncbi:MAG: hypothetical protein ACR2GX_05650 [Candidatus Dormibacteria bacterium]
MPTFTTDTRIEAPIERCFDLARSVDLHTQSSHVPERAVAGKTSGLLELGDEVTWEARHFWKLQRLTSRIVELILDGFGGTHPVGAAVENAPPAYTANHDIFRAVVAS